MAIYEFQLPLSWTTALYLTFVFILVFKLILELFFSNILFQSKTRLHHWKGVSGSSSAEDNLLRYNKVFNYKKIIIMFYNQNIMD